MGICVTLGLESLGLALNWHLIWGNLLLGVLEGWLLSRWFKSWQPAPYVWMISANFLASWATAISLGKLGDAIFPAMVLQSLPMAMGLVGVGCILLMVLVKWPIVRLAGGKVFTQRGAAAWLAALKGTVAINLVIGSGLFCFYLYKHNFSLITKTRPADVPAAWVPSKGWLYYVDAVDAHLYRCRLNGNERELVSAQEPIANPNFFLMEVGKESEEGWLVFTSKDDLWISSIGRDLYQHSARGASPTGTSVDIDQGTLFWQGGLKFKRRSSGGPVRLKLDTLWTGVSGNRYFWLPDDMAVARIRDRVFLIHVGAMEIYEIPRVHVRGEPVVIWER